MKMKPAFQAFKFPKFSKASEALAMAKRILRHENRWVQNDLAVYFDDDGDQTACSTKSKNAQAFCALGAVQFVNGPAQRKAIAFLREAAKTVSGQSNEYVPDNDNIFYINDKYGYKATLEMFTLAIKSARKAERA